jgi:hypothetical protein
MAVCRACLDGRLQRYIREHDAVREVLLALQGRANVVLVRHPDDSDVFMVGRTSHTRPAIPLINTRSPHPPRPASRT